MEHQQRKRLHPVVKRLLLIRALRSIGQGAMVVDLTLYLKDLDWNSVLIGSVLTAGGLIGALLIFLVGVLSDRFGRKPFLLVYELLTAVGALMFSWTTHVWVLAAVIVFAGFGRGQSGAAGPFSPAEQAWLARFIGREQRGYVFSLNNAIGFFGMAAGSALGGLPALWQGVSPIVEYRPVFWWIAGVSIIASYIIWKTEEPPIDNAQSEPNQPTPVINDDATIRHQENKEMLKLGLVNLLNGLAVGLTGPMMVYWFNIRYGATAAEIGVTLSLGFLLTGMMSLVNGKLASRMGMVKTVTVMRVVGSSLMLLFPFMPTFIAASVLYIFRNAINRGTQGNRSALSASLTRDSRRGFATSVNALSMRLPSSIGPTITGALFQAGHIFLPLVLTSVLQLGNAAIYQWLFGKYDQREKGTV